MERSATCHPRYGAKPPISQRVRFGLIRLLGFSIVAATALIMIAAIAVVVTIKIYFIK